MSIIKECIEGVKWFFKTSVELHHEKEFRRTMIFPYISLFLSIIALIMTFLPRPI